MCHQGRFLRGVLRDLAVWSKDEAQFTADCRKGSAFSPGLTAKAVNYPPSEKDMMDWSSFKRFVKKVHQKLCSVRKRHNGLALSSYFLDRY